MPSITRSDLVAALPDVTTSMKLPGIDKPVTIYRDPWGIPHIKAENEHDLFFAQGFATAQDRLFHMDYDRLRCLGRWAEYAGPAAFAADALMRRRGLDRVSKLDYQAASPEARTMLDAYSAGVNAFIDSTKSLPVEYKLLGVRPEQWEPWHCVLAYKVRNTAEGSFANKLFLARLAAEIGPERTAKITPGYLPGQLLTLPPGAVYEGPIENAVSELAEAAKHAAYIGAPDGESNGWAVSGKKTVSGLPLVAGDSHRGLDTPNVYYQTHLSCPTFSALGHAVPGYPGVLHFCHNEHVAWGMTHGMAETQDLFVEQLRPIAGGYEYLFKNEWRKAETTTATLRARGGAKRTVSVVTTHHGPVISGDPDSGWAISLADPGSGPEPTHWVNAAYKAMKSRSADEFEAAMDGWTDRTNNYPYADTRGNFGYKFGGLVPMRSRQHAFGPAAGWTGENEWTGFIPRPRLPRLRNPESGWVVTCNQRVVDEQYPYFMSIAYAPEHRAKRIANRISQVPDGKMTVEAMASIHSERISLPATYLLEIVRDPAIDASSWTATVNDAWTKLRSWNASMDAESPAAAIYSVLRREIVGHAVRHWYGSLADDALSAKDDAGLNHIGRFIDPMIADQMKRGETAILPGGETWQSVIAGAFPSAVAWLEKTLGKDQSKWSWGRLHRTAHTHPLAAAFASAAPLLNPPAVQTHGDRDTPLAGSFKGSFNNVSASVNRYVHDPSDWSNGRWIVPLGASGHPGSPHYADQQELWAKVETIPQLWEWDDIEARAETTQTLEPA